MDPRNAMEQVADSVGTEFESDRRILTFESWLGLFMDSPYRLSRSAPQYVADMFDFFGAREVETPKGQVRRFRLFDHEFLDGEGRVFGQEDVQNRIYRLVRAAAQEGRTDKLILLHGPNGSGKSVIVESIFRGLERYSHEDEGALYRFNWVFPRSSVTDDSLGFGVRAATGDMDSYALLEGESLSARLICELKDHPFWLIPRNERRRILEESLERKPDDRSRSFTWVLDGDLSQKSKGIYEALLTGYQGDWRKVLRHVQVERYFISQRFRTGAVTILPMGSVDAQEQQITADLSVQNLPPVLQNLKIFEPFGDLIDASGGVVEYGDFLKRPVDLNKYLLNAVEKGTISLSNSFIYLNLVMLGTTNEKHLDAFKSTPDFTSFKGRIELVPAPYLLTYGKEAELYRDMVGSVIRDVHVSPHSFEIAALWAVLTRLLRPDPDVYTGRLREIVQKLTTLEKARLYDSLEVPDSLERDDRQFLRAGAQQIMEEFQDNVIYEGRFGASPREMRMVLTQAALDEEHPCLSPDLVIKQIHVLIRDKTVYDFLKLKESGGYHDPEAFTEQVADVYARLVLEEMQDAMQLISEAEYDRRFDEYFEHVLAFTRKEKVRNPQSGALEAPSEKIMRTVEDVLKFEEPRDTFRQNLVARIGAFAVDHPNEQVNFRSLFPDLLRAVKKDFFEKRAEKMRSLLGDFPTYGTDDFAKLPAERRELLETAMADLTGNRGYCEACARAAAAFLKARFPEEP